VRHKKRKKLKREDLKKGHPKPEVLKKLGLENELPRSKLRGIKSGYPVLNEASFGE
jgi:hypothetical protein